MSVRSADLLQREIWSKDDDGGLKSAASNRLREKSCLEFLLCEKFSPVFFRTDTNSGRKEKKVECGKICDL